MRKLVGILIVCFFFSFWGCETKYYSVTITNESSKQATYTYNDSTDTLESEGSKAYQVKAYTQSPRDISVSQGAMSVKMHVLASGEEYRCEGLSPIPLQVHNKLGILITITADKYIEDGAGNTVLTIEPIAKIYTDHPQFIVSSGTMENVSWNKWEIKEGGTMDVTIE
jgi:hypothetical protein